MLWGKAFSWTHIFILNIYYIEYIEHIEHVYSYEHIYVQSADVHFAVPQLISAAQNERGLIRDHSAQTTTRVVGIAYCYWLSLYIHVYVCIYI